LFFLLLPSSHLQQFLATYHFLNKGIKMHSFLIDDKVIAKTPRHLGVNVEVQDHHERSNLWDWLADSGATILREFHPEKNLRRHPAAAETFDHVTSPESFNSFRQRLIADPRANIPWNDYLFAEQVPWLGVPDGIVGKLKEAGLDAVISMGYGTTNFPRPLIPEWIVDGIPRDDQIDWGAAACAYEFYFAMQYRYASRFGITHFMLHNEPEYNSLPFHLPPDLIDKEKGRARGPRGELALATQLGVLARMARNALEDVRPLLADKRIAERLFLTGPASHASWEAYWRYSHPYVDALDYHHYDRKAESFRRTYDRVAMRARQYGKKTAISEFNLMAGPLRPPEMFFNMENALDMAALLMTALSFTKPEDPGCEFATLYHFQFPATHRNYKNLVYGDMNLVDWTGHDVVSNEFYPTFEELQLRFPTPAYHLFRMLARCVPGNTSPLDSHQVLDCGSSIIGNNAQSTLRFLAIQQEERLVISILNPSKEMVPEVVVELELLHRRYAFAVVRETSITHCDTAIAQHRLESTSLKLNLPSESLTQVVLTPLDLEQIKDLRLEEKSATPGTAETLGLNQTTRLRAIGQLDGRDIDLTDLNVVWTSSQPEAVVIHQGGLLQRMRRTKNDAVIVAQTLNGVVAPPLKVPADFADRCPQNL
jgi:hypothetical protein